MKHGDMKITLEEVSITRKDQEIYPKRNPAELQQDFFVYNVLLNV